MNLTDEQVAALKPIMAEVKRLVDAFNRLPPEVQEKLKKAARR